MLFYWTFIIKWILNQFLFRNLENNKLQGTIPPEIKKLFKLRTL